MNKKVILEGEKVYKQVNFTLEGSEVLTKKWTALMVFEKVYNNQQKRSFESPDSVVCMEDFLMLLRPFSLCKSKKFYHYKWLDMNIGLHQGLEMSP